MAFCKKCGAVSGKGIFVPDALPLNLETVDLLRVLLPKRQ